MDVIEVGTIRIGTFNRILEQLQPNSVETGDMTGDFGRALLAFREQRQSDLSITLATGWAEALTKR